MRNKPIVIQVDEDADPEDAHENADEDAESDAAVLGRISDLVHACFKVSFLSFSRSFLLFYFQTFGSAFYPLIESALPGVVAMLEPAREYTDRQWAVCMIDDLIEFAPQVLVFLLLASLIV